MVMRLTVDDADVHRSLMWNWNARQHVDYLSGLESLNIGKVVGELLSLTKEQWASRGVKVWSECSSFRHVFNVRSIVSNYEGSDGCAAGSLHRWARNSRGWESDESMRDDSRS